LRVSAREKIARRKGGGKEEGKEEGKENHLWESQDNAPPTLRHGNVERPLLQL
jgi:hypothetical protein